MEHTREGAAESKVRECLALVRPNRFTHENLYMLYGCRPQNNNENTETQHWSLTLQHSDQKNQTDQQNKALTNAE